MSVAFILNPGYNTINNVHHTFWDQGEDCVANESLNPVLAVATSLSAPSHIVTGGTTPAQLFMSDPITLETDAPQFKAPILQAPSAELEEITELTPAAGITFLNDAHFTSGTGVDEVVRDIDGVGTLTCSTLKYTTLDPAIPEADVSQWATFGASANVNLNGKNLTDSTRSYISVAQPIFAVSSTSNSGSEFGNSINDSSISSTIDLYTNRGFSGANRGQLNVRAANSTGGTAFYANPKSVTLNTGGYGGDLQLSTSGSGKYRLIYDNSNKAITVNQSGALCFNSTFGTNTPVEGSFGTAGQIIQSNGSSAPPSWVNAPAPDVPSAWSEYPATQNVAMAAHELTNCAYLEVKPVGNSAGMIIQNTLLDPTSDAGFLLQTDGDGDTIPSAVTSISLKPSNAPNTTWEQQPSAFTLQTTDKAVFACTDFIKVKQGDNTQAFVMNNSGALSFDTNFNSGTPSYSFGTSGQLLSSNGVNAPSWVDAPTPGDPSTWSEYPATEQVDLVTYGFKSSTNTFDTSNGLTIDGSNSNIVSNSTSNADSERRSLTITLGTLEETYSQFRMACNSGLQAVKLSQGFTYSPGSGVMSSANNRDIVFQSGDEGSINTANIRFAYDGSSKAYTINPSGALAFNADWNGTSPIIEGSYGTSGQIIQSNGSSAAPSWVSPAISGRYVLYVATNGLDANAGDITNPKLTIQSAINTATALYPQQVAIVIAPGVYSGALSITTPNITLLGYAPSANQNLLTQIVGNISIACTASQDLYYSQIGIFNLQVAGSITDTSSAVHSLNIEQCRLAGTGRIVWQNSSANNRTRLERVVLLHGDAGAGIDPLLCFSSGMATLNLLDITSKDNAPVLQFDGTATLNTCTLCNFASTTTSATAAPIVYIAIANGGTAPLSQKGFAFAFCAFTYSAPVARAFSSGKNCGIVTDSITGNINLNITYNAFNLLLCDATCFVVSDINKNTPSKASTVRFFSNFSTYLATGIDTLVGNKTTFAAVA